MGRRAPRPGGRHRRLVGRGALPVPPRSRRRLSPLPGAPSTANTGSPWPTCSSPSLRRSACQTRVCGERQRRLRPDASSPTTPSNRPRRPTGNPSPQAPWPTTTTSPSLPSFTGGERGGSGAWRLLPRTFPDHDDRSEHIFAGPRLAHDRIVTVSTRVLITCPHNPPLGCSGARPSWLHSGSRLARPSSSPRPALPAPVAPATCRCPLPDSSRSDSSPCPSRSLRLELAGTVKLCPR